MTIAPKSLFASFLEGLDAALTDHKGPLLVVIAGHNGAGKSTCYREYLRDALAPYLDIHIDPDALEKEIRSDWVDAPLSDEEFSIRAAREATRQRLQHIEDGIAFSMETVLSDPIGDKLGFMAEAVSRGYYVVLLAVGLDSAEKSQKRVDLRVARHGHAVKPEKIVERYPRVSRNLARAVGLVSAALVVDNSTDNFDDDGGAYFPFAHFVGGKLRGTMEPMPSWWTANFPPTG